MAITLQLRRDTEASWASANPILPEGEIGIELGTNKFKIGNGVDAWNDLKYFITPDDLFLNVEDLVNWPAGIDLSKFEYLNGVSSDIQYQLDVIASTVGQPGYTGSQGDIGYTGSAGPQGDIGYTGSQGDAGPIGYVGSASTEIGYTGSQGSSGYTGSVGDAGTQGVIGYTGSKGDVGTAPTLAFSDNGDVVGTAVIDVTAGRMQRVKLTGPTIVSFTAWPAAGSFSELLLEVENGGTDLSLSGITWIKSDGSFTTDFSQLSITLQTTGIDFITLWARDGGVTVFGKVIR